MLTEKDLLVLISIMDAADEDSFVPYMRINMALNNDKGIKQRLYNHLIKTRKEKE